MCNITVVDDINEARTSDDYAPTSQKTSGVFYRREMSTGFKHPHNLKKKLRLTAVSTVCEIISDTGLPCGELPVFYT